MENGQTAAVQLMTMIHGSWQTHAVAAFAELGLADLLADGPRPIAELGEEAGASPVLFTRFARACRGLGLLAEEPPGTVRLTEMGALLASTGASLRDFALSHARPAQLRPFELLTQAVRDGKPTAAAALGEPIWEYYASRPDEAAVLGGGINGVAALEAPAVVAATDLTGCRTIVELRGGISAILAALLDVAPDARGVLVDRPGAAEAARQLIGGQLRDRVEARAAGELEPPPDVAADLYLITHGLHFLDDDRAWDALVRLRNVSQQRTRILIIDPVLTADSPAVCDLLDLHMYMLLGGGRQRTADELRALLSGTGWHLDEIVPVGVLSDLVTASRD